nr:hypothetical protein [Kofleriaceae bacterium]
MYFDEDGPTYFSYVLGQAKFELAPDIVQFMSTKLNYEVSDVARKLRVEKFMEGRAMLVRLAGDLDQTFLKDQLAEGLAGTVVVDVGGVGRIEPAGAAQWRGFVQMVSPRVSELFIVCASPTFVAKLCNKDDVGTKVQVLSINLPYSCKHCATSGSQLVDVAEHYDVLQLATAPDLKCHHCKYPLTCVASESLMAMLPGLPLPTVTPEQRKLIEDVRERKPEAPQIVAPAEADADAAGAQQVSMWVPVAAAFVVVGLAGGAFLGYRALVAPRTKSEGVGPQVSPSATGRPAWITADLPGGAYCKDLPNQSVACVGVSTAAVAKDEALAEANDAALESIANAIAGKVDNEKWRAALPPIWQSTREAKLAAFEREPNNMQAHRDVRDARHAVARLLSITAAGAVSATPSSEYWEESGSGDGKRYVAFVEFTVLGTDVAQLAQRYAQDASAIGAGVVDVFPSLGWRYPTMADGAVVIAIADGGLKSRGITEGNVLLEVSGRAIANAAGFAKVAAEEMARLELVGGNLELKVQAGDAAPKLVQETVAKKTKDLVPANAKNGGKTTGGKSPGVKTTTGTTTTDKTTDGKTTTGTTTTDKTTSGTPTDGKTTSGTPIDGKTTSGTPTDGKTTS